MEIVHASDACSNICLVMLLKLRQVNKNWLLKGRVGTDGAAGALGLRIWGAGISLAATASVHLSYAAPLTPRYGGTLQIENFGALMYRRAAVTGGDGSVAAGRAVLQRHEATGQETANAQGLGTMVSMGRSQGLTIGADH